MSALETLVEAVPVTDGETQTTVSQNVGMSVVCPVTGQGVEFSGSAPSATSSAREAANLQVSIQPPSATPSMSGVRFTLPSQALLQAKSIRNRRNSTLTVSGCSVISAQFIMFKDAKLFDDNSFSASNDAFVGSNVIASQLGRSLNVKGLSTPVEISFEVSKQVQGIDNGLTLTARMTRRLFIEDYSFDQISDDDYRQLK